MAKLYSLEWRMNISEAKMGHPVSVEARRKLAQAARGRRPSEEARRRMSIAQRLRQQPMLVRRKIAEANYGSKSHFAKLTEAQAQAILDSGDGTAAMMRRYNVSGETVRRIRKGKTWPHLRRRISG